jgi:ABC-2 type transport system ATP-binding protein
VTAAVEGKGVAFAYGERQALKGIDFSVARGERHGFLGPNGSGKSTLFKILATLLPPAAGQVTVLGLDLKQQTMAVRARLGVVFQSPALDKKLRVDENLRCGGNLYGLSGGELERRIDELLAHAQLTDRKRDRVEELSGGLRRRVETAKALLHKPELLLLDEASTGLDPAARRDLWQLLKSQPEVTVLFTTHLMDEAGEADRLTILDQGSVVAEGTPRELMAEVGGQVLEIEGADPAALANELKSAFGVEAKVLQDAVRVRSEGLHELVPKVMQRFGDRVGRLTLSHPSLEDVFIARTGRRFENREDQAEVLDKRGRKKKVRR